jgi:SHS family lactate transporter-like MFS transporter
VLSDSISSVACCCNSRFRDPRRCRAAGYRDLTLDAFDFTAFLLIIAPIAKEFHVLVPAVAAVATITLWMRLIGATASGWLADRIARKTPLMISIAWYSVCNFAAGLAPSFFLLFLFSGAAWHRHGR